MRQYHPAVAAGTQDRSLGSLMRHLGHSAGVARPQVVGDGTNRERQIGARVSIRNRKHVDAIQLFPVPLSIVTRGDERPPQPRTVQISDLHGHVCWWNAGLRDQGAKRVNVRRRGI